MMTIHIVLFSLVLLLLNCSSQNSEASSNDEQEHFKAYVNLFKPIELPLVWDRKAVFNISWSVYDERTQTYRKDNYTSIPHNLIEFIPKKIRDGVGDYHYRAIYWLPPNDDIVSLIVAKDAMDGEDQSMLFLYLVTYNRHGTVLSHALIAGYHIDFWEEFMTMEDQRSIIKARSVFLERTNRKHLNLSYQTQTINKCFIGSNGLVECQEVQSQTGYFEGDWMGYRFVTQ